MYINFCQKILVTLVLPAVLCLAGAAKAQTIREQDISAISEQKGKWAEDEILVKFQKAVTADNISQINSKYGGTLKKTSRFAKVMRIGIGKGRSAKETVELYRSNPEIEYAELNYRAWAFFVPNDTFFSYQWHLDNNNANYGGIHMKAAWDLQRGDPNVIVAVVDTGVAYENYTKYYLAPDLSNTSFVSGYDFYNNDSHPNDDNGHGTHVTGTIAQSTNNNEGVAGVAFGCSIMPIKVLNSKGNGTYDDIADGIYFAADHGAKVINMSLGGTGDSITLRNAVAYAYEKGVTIVCSAGNEYLNGNPTGYPAAYDDYCIAVGATRYDQTRSYYSSTGSYVDLAAPGGDLTVDQNNDGYGDGVLQETFNLKPGNFAYYFYQGTSMAAPHVSGLAALLLSKGVVDPDKIRLAMQSTARDQGPTGWDVEYGWGLIDAPAALQFTIAGDLTGDLEVTPEDLVIFTGQWLATNPPLPADFNGDGIVDLLDLAILTENRQR